MNDEKIKICIQSLKDQPDLLSESKARAIKIRNEMEISKLPRPQGMELTMSIIALVRMEELEGILI